MAKKNSAGKRRLQRIFGHVDMFVEAGVEEKLEKLAIKGYKTYEAEQRLKGRILSQKITFHHLRHRSEGGDQSVENGALIGYGRHEYMHSLPREEEEIANNIIRDWKLNFVIMNGKGEISESGQIIPDFSDCLVIPAYDTPPSIREKKYRQQKHPTRAQRKQELFDLLDEIAEDDEELEI